MRSPEKETAKNMGWKKSKEAEPNGRKQKHTGIDVDANQTVAIMTPAEAESLTTTAGLTMLKEAKKGLRVQAFKVDSQEHTNHIHYISSNYVAL